MLSSLLSCCKSCFLSLTIVIAMSCSLVSPLVSNWKTIWSMYLFAININDVMLVITRCSKALWRVAQIWITNNKINFTFEALDVVLVKVLKSCLAIVIELAHAFIITSTESFGRLGMSSVSFSRSGAKQSSCSTYSYVLRISSWWERFVIQQSKNSLLAEQNFQYFLSLSPCQISIIKIFSTTSSLTVSTSRLLWIILYFTFSSFLLNFILDIIYTLSQNLLKVIFLFDFFWTQSLYLP